MAEKISKIEEYRRENPNRLTAEQFAALEQEILHPQKGLISDEYLDYQFWHQGLPSQQECFAADLRDEMVKAVGSFPVIFRSFIPGLPVTEKSDKIEKVSKKRTGLWRLRKYVWEVCCCPPMS